MVQLRDLYPASVLSSFLNPPALPVYITSLPAIVPRTDGPAAPTITGSSPGCTKWYTIMPGQDCASVAKENGITTDNFLMLNPAVSADCTTNFWVGYSYCVATTSGQDHAVADAAEAISTGLQGQTRVAAAAADRAPAVAGSAQADTTSNAQPASEKRWWELLPPQKLLNANTSDGHHPLLFCDQPHFDTISGYCITARPSIDCQPSPFLDIDSGQGVVRQVKSLQTNLDTKTEGICTFYPDSQDCTGLSISLADDRGTIANIQTVYGRYGALGSYDCKNLVPDVNKLINPVSRGWYKNFMYQTFDLSPPMSYNSGHQGKFSTVKVCEENPQKTNIGYCWMVPFALAKGTCTDLRNVSIANPYLSIANTPAPWLYPYFENIIGSISWVEVADPNAGHCKFYINSDCTGKMIDVGAGTSTSIDLSGSTEGNNKITSFWCDHNWANDTAPSNIKAPPAKKTGWNGLAYTTVQSDSKDSYNAGSAFLLLCEDANYKVDNGYCWLVTANLPEKGSVKHVNDNGCIMAPAVWNVHKLVDIGSIKLDPGAGYCRFFVNTTDCTGLFLNVDSNRPDLASMSELGAKQPIGSIWCDFGDKSKCPPPDICP